MVKQEFSFQNASTDSYLGKLLNSEKEPNLVNKLADILSVLSKPDALTIFLCAKNGLESELDTPQKIGLTKKQYYTRLKQLVDLGLLSKSESKYFHSVLGSIVHEKHLMGLLNSMKVSKELEMIDLLKKTSKYTPEEITKFVSKLNPAIQPADTLAAKTHFEMTPTFDSMVRKILDIIEFAEKEILLVTRFPNELIINAILKKSDQGVPARIIADLNMVGNYFKSEKDKIGHDDKNQQERIKVVSNPFYPSRIERRYAKTPYCLLLVDEKEIGLEIIDNYDSAKFKLAIFGTDKSLSQQMKSEFEHFWREAHANPPRVKEIH